MKPHERVELFKSDLRALCKKHGAIIEIVDIGRGELATQEVEVYMKTQYGSVGGVIAERASFRFTSFDERGE